MVKLKESSQKTTIKILQKHLEDRFWRLNNLYYILDENGNKILFQMNKVQCALYLALHWLNLIPKSRQHGITTFIAIYILDMCLFNDNVRAGIVAHKLEDAKRIFRDKVKYAFDHLPDDLKSQFFLPTGKPPKDGAQELLFANNSSIYVGTSMRSGTLQIFHGSEYGWLCTYAPKKAREIKAGTLETLHDKSIVFLESTIEGPTGDFTDMCKAADDDRLKKKALGPMDWKIHTFVWYEKESNTTDPKYIDITEYIGYFKDLEKKTNIKLTAGQKAWYVGKRKTLGKLIYNQHPSTLEEAFMASVTGSYLGDTFTWLYEQGRIGDVPHNPGLSTHMVCDPGYTSAWWLFQVPPTGYVNFIRYYEDTGKDPAFYAKLFKQWETQYGYNYGHKFAPFDIDNNQYKLVDQDGLLEVFARAGIVFTQLEVEKDVLLGIVKTNQFLKTARFDEAGCSIGINKARAYHESLNTTMSTDDKPVFTGVPAKDGNDHAADGLRYARKCIAYIDTSQPSSKVKSDWKKLKEKYT